MGVSSFAEYGNGPLGFGGMYGRTESGARSASEAAIVLSRNEIEGIVFPSIGKRGISETRTSNDNTVDGEGYYPRQLSRLR